MNKKYKLPKEFATKWLLALRSGKYKQNKLGALYNYKNNSYCCLGVAASILGCSKENMNQSYIDSDIAPKKYPSELLVSEYSEPDKLPILLAKLNDGYNKYINELKNTILLKEVDISKGYDFNQIADFIELNVEFY